MESDQSSEDSELNQSSEDSELNQSLVKLKEKYDKGAQKQAEIQEKVDSAKFIATNALTDKELKKIHKEKLVQYKNMKKIDLTKSLNGKKYSTTAIIKMLN